jgi:hypothetical protein
VSLEDEESVFGALHVTEVKKAHSFPDATADRHAGKNDFCSKVDLPREMMAYGHGRASDVRWMWRKGKRGKS